MLTYQDLVALGEDSTEIMNFVKTAIDKHKSSKEYEEAKTADLYNQKRNKTIEDYVKVLHDVTGAVIPDTISANNKIKSNFFNEFVTQEVSYLLGNGVTFKDAGTEDKVGDDFDNVLMDIAENALVHSVAFGFWNYDHVEGFSFLEFVPLWDEEDGGLKAGIRFWQIDPKKPLRATLYRLEGYTDYIWRDNEGEIVDGKENKPYKEIIKSTKVDGETIYDGENYPTFPIVPLWADKKYKQSTFIGMREQIDAYDLIKSGFANDLDDVNQIYWILQNAGGMDDVDLKKFVERIRTVGAVVLDDGVTADNRTVDVPYESRQAMLAILRNDLYEFSMALDVKAIASGAITATQIEASYEPLNEKTDKFELCVNKFIKGIMEIAGIDDTFTFTRSVIVNKTEEIQTVLQAAAVLDPDYVTEKILTILGDGDRVEDMLKKLSELSLMMGAMGNGQGTQADGQDNI